MKAVSGAAGSGCAPSPPALLDPRDVGVGGEPRVARRQRLVGEAPQVLDQRQLQHARPRPQLADRQRRDALVAVEEHRELLAVEAAVAVADQLDRHRVDARVAGVLARGERRQLAVVGAAAGAGGCRGSRTSPDGSCRAAIPPPAVTSCPVAHVVGQRAVGVAQHARVVVEARKDVAGAAPRARDRW